PAALILKRDGEPRLMPRPRDRRHDNPMLLAEHARRVGLQERERGPQVKRPPPPLSHRVLPSEGRTVLPRPANGLRGVSRGGVSEEPLDDVWLLLATA